jgi:hypothetical protein
MHLYLVGMERRSVEHNQGSCTALKVLKVRIQRLMATGLLVMMAGCSGGNESVASRNVNYYQDWGMQPGDTLAGYRVRSGLGDIAVNLNGETLFMPFDGTVQPQEDKEDLCVILSSPEVPAYLFRLCGIKQPRLGDRNQGDPIGSGDVVAFATLRRQADGTWAMVEPAKELIEQFLEKVP